MLCWTSAMAVRHLFPEKKRVANVGWLFGLSAFAVHVWMAFEGFYGWNFSVALDETARLTEAVTGWRSSVGLWVNFAFFAVLTADLAMRVLKKGGVGKTQNRILEILVIFMMINGAVIFAFGPVRWFGSGLLLGLATIIWYAKARHRNHA